MSAPKLTEQQLKARRAWALTGIDGTEEDRFWLAALDELIDLRARTTWRPIADAPRGELVLVAWTGERALAYRTSEGWWQHGGRRIDNAPLWWCALPEPPP